MNCPRCGNEAKDTLKIDTGMRLALESSGHGDLPESVCGNCYEELMGQVSRGVQLMAEKKAKEQNKLILWKSRVNLVKQGRQLMTRKQFSEAAVSYEKYLRILEICHDLKSGELTPDIFNRSTRSKEITVIASVYWDLLRIYDTSPAYGDRMGRAANKLAQFLPYSTIYPDIVKKAESFQRSAKNPQVVKRLLRSSRMKNRCFVASSAFSDPSDPTIFALRTYRDEKLRQSQRGRRFIAWYYKNSPDFAHWLDLHPHLKPLARFILRILAKFILRP